MVEIKESSFDDCCTVNRPFTEKYAIDILRLKDTGVTWLFKSVCKDECFEHGFKRLLKRFREEQKISYT